jgi:predicted HicB family RNase H-like nuclease
MHSKTKTKKDKHFGVRMQSIMFARLEAESIYHNISIGTLVRTAIQQYINQTNSGE